MRLLVIIVISFIFVSSLAAQREEGCTHEIEGVVMDADTREALPFVQVVVAGTQQYALTDDNGRYHIKDLCKEAPTLLVSCLGYFDTSCDHATHLASEGVIYLQQESSVLDEVTVTSERAREDGTVSISQLSIHKEDLASDVTQTLASAIADINGVTFTSLGSNVQLPVIHGLYGNRVLILNNGIKHGFQNWGSDHGPEIDIAIADRVTVLKGAAGVRYGPEALGGAVVVESNPLHFLRDFNVKVGSGYQTNGRGYYLNSEISKGFENWSYHIGANYTNIGDRHAPDYSLTNTGKRERSMNAGLRFKHGAFDFKTYYSYLNQNLGLLRSSVAESGTAIVRALSANEPIIVRPFSYDINEPNQLAQHHLGKIEADWRYAEDAKLSLRVGAQLNKREEYDVRRNADSPIIDLDLLTTDIQLDWDHPNWFNLDGLIGLQLFTQNNDNNPGTFNTPFIPNYNTFRLSGFVIESFQSGKNTYELGLRFDHEYNNVRGREANNDVFRDSYNFINFTASLGYVLKGSDSHTFRSNIATAWRTPNMAELYSFGQHGFRTSFGLLRYYASAEADGALRTDRVAEISESGVSPERGFKWINEWQIKSKANTFIITGYVNYIQNFIFDRPIAVVGTIRGPMPVFIYDQADAIFTGVDFSWQHTWTDDMEGTLGFSYLYSRNLSDEEALINQPPINVNYQLNVGLPELLSGVESQLSISPGYTFRQFQAPRTILPQDLIDGTAQITTESEIFDFRDAPDGFFLLDIAWRLRAKKFSASITAQNVFNARYRNYLNEMRYFADEPGLNILFTLNYFLHSK